MAAGTSTILTSATRHCTPNVPEPSLVIRLTTCPAGSDGGMMDAGGGVCVIDWIATVNVVSVIAPAMAFRISSSRYYFAIKNVSRIVRAADRAAATVVNKQREACFPDHAARARRRGDRIAWGLLRCTSPFVARGVVFCGANVRRFWR